MKSISQYFDLELEIKIRFPTLSDGMVWSIRHGFKAIVIIMVQF